MSIWRGLLVLIRAQAMVARNTFWRSGFWNRFGLIILVIVASIGTVGLYFISYGLTLVMRSAIFAEALHEAAALNPAVPDDPLPLLQAVPGTVLLVASILLVFSSFSSVLSVLYLSGDMDMLLTKPIPMRAVFIIKFFQGLVVQYTRLFVVLLPVLLGYVSGMGYGLAALVLVVCILLVLPLLPMSLGALLVMLVVRLIPAHRAREMVGVLGGLLVFGVYMFIQLAPAASPHTADVEHISELLQLDLPILPSAWAGRALVAAGEGALLTMAVYSGLFLLLSLLVFAGCLLLAERLYYAGWSNVAVQGGRTRQRQRTASPGHGWDQHPHWSLAGWLQAFDMQLAAIFLKDWRVFPRDLHNTQQFIFPLALIGIWFFRLLQMPQEGADDEMVLRLSSVGVTFVTCFSISNAVASPAISREGRAYWLLKLAPISPLRILTGKLLLAYLPYPFVGTPLLLLLILVSHATVYDLLADWGLLLLLGLGNTSLSLGVGAIFPRMNWENPQQQTTFLAGCLGAGLAQMYIMLIVIAVVVPPLLADVLGKDAGLVLGAAGWLVALALTLFIVWAALHIGSSRLEQLEL